MADHSLLLIEKYLHTLQTCQQKQSVLAHLYFYCFMEHLISMKCSYSQLASTAEQKNKVCFFSFRSLRFNYCLFVLHIQCLHGAEGSERILLLIEKQAAIQCLLQQMAQSLDCDPRKNCLHQVSNTQHSVFVQLRFYCILHI